MFKKKKNIFQFNSSRKKIVPTGTVTQLYNLLIVKLSFNAKMCVWGGNKDERGREKHKITN